ncbi:MAG: bifunctional adenosylcobinamide kinase/adenosylcobinamide-phosphate guanylyltransferase [Granulosicoccaceae bacterium]
MIHLVLGGARSGKSSLAEQMACDSGRAVRVVATATAEDAEMLARIERHKQQRPGHWVVQEEPLHLSELIRDHQDADEILLIDCLTLWLSNQLFHPCKPNLNERRTELCEALAESRSEIILVSNEVGMGIVPLGAVNREFADQAGWLNQAVARVADQVSFVVAGLPLRLKGEKS